MSDDFASEATPTDEHPAPRSPFDHLTHRRLGSLEASRRFWRWAVGIGVPVIGGGLFLLGIWLADMVRSSAQNTGATQATIEGLKTTLTSLDLDVREIRARILKLSGVEPDPGLGVVASGAP